MTSAVPRARVPRRTQAQRSESTRRELVAATIRVIEARGLEGASSFEIAREAGMTPGAIQHHFESKRALIQQAATDLIHSDDGHGTLAVWPSARTALRKRAVQAIESAWEAMYGPSRYLTMWSIFLSCRSDPELLAHMATEREQLRQRMLASFFKSFPELGGHPDAEEVANMVFATLRGMGLNELFAPPPPVNAALLRQLADFVRIRCEEATQATPPTEKKPLKGRP